MLPPKSASYCVIVCALLLLPGCTSLDGKRFAERAKLCQQSRVEIPDWPEIDFEAYAIELLGVIREDRMRERVERECVEGL